VVGCRAVLGSCVHSVRSSALGGNRDYNQVAEGVEDLHTVYQARVCASVHRRRSCAGRATVNHGQGLDSSMDVDSPSTVIRSVSRPSFAQNPVRDCLRHLRLPRHGMQAATGPFKVGWRRDIAQRRRNRYALTLHPVMTWRKSWRPINVVGEDRQGRARHCRDRRYHRISQHRRNRLDSRRTASFCRVATTTADRKRQE